MAMISDYAFRRYEHGDAFACHRIRYASFLQDFTEELPGPELRKGANAYHSADFANVLRSLQTYVAIRDGNTVGFCGIRLLRGSAAEVEFIYLSPEARGSGVGRQLLETTEIAAIRCNPGITLFSVVTSAPERNLAFWERNEYQVVSTTYYLCTAGTMKSLRLEKRVGRGLLVDSGYRKLPGST